jgi:hypothetical protein
MTSLSNVLDVSGIKRVIWIDDCFYKNEESTKFDFIGSMEVFVIENSSDGMDAFIERLKFDIPELGVVSSLLKEEKFAEALVDLPEISGFAETILLEITEGYSEQVDELTDASFNELKQEFTNIEGIYFESLSFSDWNKSKSKILSITDKTLFLVDLENTKEPGENDLTAGKDVLGQIYESDNDAYSILLTHTFTDASNEHQWTLDLKSDIASLKDETPLSTLTKEHFKKEISAIKATLHDKLTTILFLYAFAKVVIAHQNEVITSVKDISSSLVKSDPLSVYRYWFESSRREGSSEQELIKRLLVSPGMKLQQHLAEGVLLLRKMSPLLKNVNNSQIDKTENTIFHEIRQSEIWLNGSEINSQYSPLSPGDIFEGKKKALYILIAGACDIAVRDNGKRKNDIGYLVPIKKRDAPLKDLKAMKDKATHVEKYSKEQICYIEDIHPQKNRLIFLEEVDSYYYADLALALPCNLNVLEWCSFNGDGSVKLSPSLASNKANLLPGWGKRLELHLQKYNDANGDLNSLYTSVIVNVNGIGASNARLKVNSENNELKVELKRIKRLQPTYVEILLSKYHQHLSRKAFEHDFIS